MQPNDPAHIDLFLGMFGGAGLLLTQIYALVVPNWLHYHLVIGVVWIVLGLALEAGLRGPLIIFGISHILVALRQWHARKTPATE